MIEIILRKSVRAKRVSEKLGDALVKMGIARYAHEPVDATSSIPIPIPPLAPLSYSEPEVIPPEAEAAADKVGGIVTTPESAATDTEAPQNEGDRTAVPQPIEQEAPAEHAAEPGPAIAGETIDTETRSRRGRAGGRRGAQAP